MQFKEEILNYETSNSDAPYIMKIGLIPVIITTPHTAKLSKPFTKAIVQYVANNLNTSFLIKTTANSDEIEDLKEPLLQIIKAQNIKLLIEIHDTKKEKAFDIEFETLKSLPDKFNAVKELEKSFKKHNINNILYNETFKSKGITKYIYGNADIDVVQIEINQKFNDLDNLKKVCDSLISFIQKYTKD